MNFAKCSRTKIPVYEPSVSLISRAANVSLFARLAFLLVLLFLADTPQTSHLANTLHRQIFAMAHKSEYSAPGALSESQTDSAKETSNGVITGTSIGVIAGTGVITGKVTIKGKGVSNIPVVLLADNFNPNEAVTRKVTTDPDGNYQITNVAPGAYQVSPLAPGFVISGPITPVRSSGFPPGGKSLVIGEGETIQNVDFELTRGGVITGKVTDSEGRPLIEYPVNLTPVPKYYQGVPVYVGKPQIVMTDDRGVYRGFGLSKGPYSVSAGQSEEMPFGMGPRGSRNRQTLYPAVKEPAKSTIIEVSEGSEATNIDITVSTGPTNDTFDVSGRIVDSATGNPVPNVMLGLKMGDETRSSSMSSPAWTSNQRGEFRFQNLTSGKYSIYIEQQMNSDFRADPISIDVIDQDLTGLVIKTIRGATVSGLIVFENGDAKVDVVNPGQLILNAFVLREGQDGSTGRAVSVKPDGSFRIGGLQAGTANFLVNSFVNQAIGFRIMRVERDGVVQPRGIEIKDEEEVTGIRLLVRFGNGSVRGIVRAENGKLPPPPRLQVWLTIPGEDASKPLSTFGSQSKVDSRGHFLFEKLPAGAYEVNASVFTPQGSVSTKQLINVADGVVTELTLTLNLKPNSASEIK